MTLNYRAVLTGLVVDLVGTVVATVIVVTVYVGALSAQGSSDEEIATMLANPADSPELTLILIAIGIFFDGLAGYITARKAGYLEYWHVLAMLGLLVVIQIAIGGGAVLPALVLALSFLGGCSAAFYGAYLVKKEKQRQPPSSD